MRKWLPFLAVILLFNSCDSGFDLSTEEQLVGFWQYNFSQRGSEQPLAVPNITYTFNPDHTYVKTLGFFDWREEGTWKYDEGTGLLRFKYKEYTDKISDSKSLDIKIESISAEELVLKEEFNDVNSLNEFVEFEFVHYIKK